MNLVHGMKVEVDTTDRKYSCTLCVYATRNMNEFKTHLMKQHQKEEHNWMVEEIQAVFSCDECSLEFPRKYFLESHLNLIHGNEKQLEQKPKSNIDEIDEIPLNIKVPP